MLTVAHTAAILARAARSGYRIPLPATGEHDVASVRILIQSPRIASFAELNTSWLDLPPVARPLVLWR